MRPAPSLLATMTSRAEVDFPAKCRCMTRSLSLAAAGLFSLAILVDPYLLAGVPSWRLHTGLPIAMLGAAGLFMHGLGFVPRTWILRILFHPAAAWLFFTAGGYLCL
jgi:predicted membrane protein